MKTAKQEAQELLDALPDDVSTETILCRLHLHAKVSRGLAQIDRGEVIPHEQVIEDDLDRWLESISGDR
jgi:predicted transcriptional regulator